jgi:hypothetical protein
MFISQVIYEHGERWWTDIDRGKPKNFEKKLSQYDCVHHKSHMGFRGDRPVTSRLSYDTAFV